MHVIVTTTVIMDPTIRRTLFSFFLVTFPHLVSCFRLYEKLLISVKTKKLQQEFLKDCLHEQVVPKSLRPRLFKQHHTPFPDSARVLLQESIQNIKREVDGANYLLRRQLGLLKQHIPQDLLEVLYATASKKCLLETNRARIRLSRKLNELCKDSVWSKCEVSGAILNLSTYVLSEVEKQVLNLGLSFALKPGKEVVLDLVASTISSNLNFPSLNGLITSSFINNFNSLDSIPRRFRVALEKLKKNKDIFITKADKSNTAVILDKSDYLEKMNVLLSDSTTYKKLTSSPLKRLTSVFNKKVKELFKDVPDIDASKFLQINPKLPHIYGLPKTHKENVPLRPIISQCGSFSYK